MAIKVLKGGFISLRDITYNLKTFRSFEKGKLSVLDIMHAEESNQEVEPYLITFSQEPRGDGPVEWSVGFKTEAERDEIYDAIIATLDS
jgi:hypothetical protein